MSTPRPIDLSDEMMVLLRASQIADGSRVCKRTGSVEYTLKHELVLYQNQSSIERKEPTRIQGCFLVGERGSISQVDSDTPLMWIVLPEDLYIFLDEVIDPPEDK